MLAWILIGAGTAWFWHDSLGVREQANKAAMQACEELRLQFLDGTVAFARMRLKCSPSAAIRSRLGVRTSVPPHPEASA